ncbi:MAG: 3-oxoacyl-ACP synthase III family protein [Gemmatimonadales bacterium]
MRLEAPGVRIADVETCDFGLMPEYDTAAVLRAARPADAEHYLTSALSRRLIAELGVARRHLTHVPGQAPIPGRLNALDLARSAVTRLQARRARDLARLDALIFVSTSNPNPCNSQAALLAEACGLSGSCMDLKAGCSGGVLGLVQGALLIRSGCERVLVVMAENLSQFTPPDDLRMLLTVGDGAACVLLERAAGPGFVAVIHGTEPALASTMTVSTPFPPADAGARYVYEFRAANSAADYLRARWRALFCESIGAAGLAPGDLAYAVFHQTHAAQLHDLTADLGLDPACVPAVVTDHGNMGTPTFAVALARIHAQLEPGQRYLLQAVGGGVSWCAIVAEHG